MEKVKIYSIEQLRDYLNQIPDEFKNNPAFLSNFESTLESTIYWDKKSVEIEVSDDYKSMRVVPEVSVERGLYNNTEPNSHMTCIDYKIDENQNIEIIRSEGYLHEANAYYNRIGTKSPDSRITSVLDTYYSRTLIDKDGIEMASCEFFKNDWPLTNVRYDDTSSLATQLLSEGYHKPASWTADGPVLPRFAYNAHVNGISRSNDNPAFANVYGYDTEGTNKNIVNATSFIGGVNTEYPDELRKLGDNRLAKYEDNKLALYDPQNRFENMELPEVFRYVSLDFESSLDRAKDADKIQIETLKERMDAANAKYRTEEYEQGRKIG